MDPSASERLRVIVDPAVCVGTGDCARLAPTAFHLRDDVLVAEVLPGAAATDRRLLREAADACPMQAISIAAPLVAGRSAAG